jgi:hypothetical protein
MSPLSLIRWPRRRRDYDMAGPLVAMPEPVEPQPVTMLRTTAPTPTPVPATMPATPKPSTPAEHVCRPHARACWDPACPTRHCRHCGRRIAPGMAHTCPDRPTAIHPQCAAAAAKVCPDCREQCGYTQPTPAHPTPGASA